MLREEHLTISRFSSHQQISFDMACLSVFGICLSQVYMHVSNTFGLIK